MEHEEKFERKNLQKEVPTKYAMLKYHWIFTALQNFMTYSLIIEMSEF